MTALRTEDAGKVDRLCIAPLVVPASSVGRVVRGERRTGVGAVQVLLRSGRTGRHFLTALPFGHTATGRNLPRPAPTAMGRASDGPPRFWRWR